MEKNNKASVMGESVKAKKRKVAWGITGGGDKIAEILEAMKDLKKQSEDVVEIEVFLSKAADTVLKFYRLEDELKRNFPKVQVELNSNSPFLAAWMQMRKYEFLLIAPASSNTVAKIANGIGDTLLTNAAIMSLKAFVPVYILPTDYRESTVYTKLPNGKEMKLRVRKEEADQVRKLEKMEDVHVLESPQKMREAFWEWIKTIKS
jgi:archaeoflavoprotein AfpA